MTYELLTVEGVTAIRCLLCDRISELPGDVVNLYCGRCHLFHETVAAARALHEAGDAHECAEWPTYRGDCAVCGLPRSDKEIIEAMAAELDTFETPIELVLRPTSALQLAGLLQLALRHPGVSEQSSRLTARAVGTTIVAHVREYFADAPAVLEVLRRGDDEAVFWEVEPPRPARVLRLRYRQRGSHIHCRLFSAAATDTTYTNTGSVVFSVDEWPDVRTLLERGVEILPEDE